MGSLQNIKPVLSDAPHADELPAETPRVILMEQLSSPFRLRFISTLNVTSFHRDLSLRYVADKQRGHSGLLYAQVHNPSST